MSPYIAGSPPVLRIRFFRTNAGGLTLVWTVGAHATATAPAVVVSANASLPRRVLLQQNHTHEKNRLAQDLIQHSQTCFAPKFLFFSTSFYNTQISAFSCYKTQIPTASRLQTKSEANDMKPCRVLLVYAHVNHVHFVIFYSKIGTLETMTNVICNGTNENHFVTKNFF